MKKQKLVRTPKIPLNKCHRCKRLFANSLPVYKGNEYCSPCYHEVLLENETRAQCSKCHKAIPKSHLLTLEGKKYCPTCVSVIRHKMAEEATRLHRAAIKARNTRTITSKLGAKKYDPDWMIKQAEHEYNESHKKRRK